VKRREFITLLGAAASWPLAARAQQPARAARIGCLVSGSPDSHGEFVTAFRVGLRELGRIEGRDYVLDLRWAEGRNERMPALANELARVKSDVVLTSTTAAALAVRHAIPTTPIVSATLVDPVGLGLVSSHARPGGNVTGILFTFEGLVGKLLELAREIVPGASTIGMLINPHNQSNMMQRRDAEALAPALRIKLVPIEARFSNDLEAAFQELARTRSEFVLILADTLFMTGRKQIAALATAARLPTITSLSEFAQAGGLINYGVDLGANYRRAAYFVDRILKGDKPADLPVEQPTKYRMVINNKAAKALELNISESFLSRADEVIE
jgi:putative ABC transport system substrate-binding protein